MMNLGFCRPCFGAGRGRKDAARMHGGEGLCLDCLKAAGVDVLAPPVPSTKVQAPLRRVVAKAPSVTFPARRICAGEDREDQALKELLAAAINPGKPVAAPLVKTVVDAPAAGGERKTTVKMLPAMNDGLCSRGCGKATHRGSCAGQGSRNYAAAVGRELPPSEAITLESLRSMVSGVFPEVDAERTNKLTCGVEALEAPEEVRMDKLVAEYVRVEDVPAAADHVRKATGRIGQLWEMLEAAPAERPRVKVACRDREHLSYTARHLQAKAVKLGRKVAIQSQGNLLYCWFEGGAA